MSVIIRLQNLPWSAKAVDIRSYFQGLSIPEGGVHIVGGEHGDAFIAFSTDEDARQAMLLDGGKLKEVKVKLSLSSRSEVIRVIEEARQQAMKIQNLMSIPTGQSLVTPVVPPQVNPLEEKKLDVQVEEKKENEYEKKSGRDNRRDKSVSRERDRRRSRDRSSDRDRSRDRSRDRGRDRRERDRRRRDRSRDRSRDRYRSRRSKSYERKRSSRDDKDKYGRDKNRDRDQDSDRRNSAESSKMDSNRKGGWEKAAPQQSTAPVLPQKEENEFLQGKDVEQSNDSPVYSTSIANQLKKPNEGQSKALLPDPPAIPQMLLQFQQNGKEVLSATQPQMQPDLKANINNINYAFPPAAYTTNPLATQPPMATMGPGMKPSTDVWHPQMGGMPMPTMMNPAGVVMPPGQMMSAPEMSIPNFPPGFPMPQPGFPPSFQPNMFSGQPGFPGMPSDLWRMATPMPIQQPIEMPMLHQKPIDVDLCVEIRGLPSHTSYVDIKKLFGGCPIPGDGIKMINDTHGYRTGIAYVKFTTPENVQLALKQNGQKVRHSTIEVLQLRNHIFDSAIDNFKPEKESQKSPSAMDIDKNEDMDERSKRSKDSPKQNRDIIDPRLQRNTPPKPFHGNGDLNTCAVAIKNSKNCSDRDVHDFFSEVGVAPTSIEFVSADTVHCLFETEEEATKAVSKNNSYLGRNVVSVFKISEFAPGMGPYPNNWQAVRPNEAVSNSNFNQLNKSQSKGDGDQDTDSRPPRRERGARVSRFDKPREEPVKPESPDRSYDDQVPPPSRMTPPIRDPRRAPLLQDPPMIRPHLDALGMPGVPRQMVDKFPSSMDRSGPQIKSLMDPMQDLFMENGPMRHGMPQDGMMMDKMDHPGRGRLMNGPMDGPFPPMNRRPGDDPNRERGNWPNRGDPRDNMDGSGGMNRRDPRGDRGDPRGDRDDMMDNHSERMDPRDRLGRPDPRDRRRRDDSRFPNQDPRVDRASRGRGPPSEIPPNKRLSGSSRPGPVSAPLSSFIDSESVDTFGQPGCVVALENVNFRADIDDILNFFSDFVIGSEDVIRRFDDHGRPTGDARVALKSSSEASRAVEMLNFKPMLGRPVKVYQL